MKTPTIFACAFMPLISVSAFAQQTVPAPANSSPTTLISTTTPAPAAVATPAPQVVSTPSTTPLAPVVAVERVKTITPGMALPSNSEVWLSFNQELNSKKAKQGDKFALSVVRDVLLGDYIVIPRGTSAWGQVSYRTGKGSFGKSAKMEFDIANIELGGRLIPLAGHYRIEGQGNTGATVGAAVAVGIFSAFVTGRSAVVAQGTEYKAFTKDALPVALAGSEVAAVATAPVAEVAAVAATVDAATATAK